MAMKLLSKRFWISILFIPFMMVSCEVGGLGGLSGGSGDTKDEPEEPLSSGAEFIEGYECVDLGLSVKWATFNVGAYSEKDFGGFYAWGETEEKQEYSENTYKYLIVEPGYWYYTKYCTDSLSGYEFFHDDKTVLDPEDDVAHVIWKGQWRMPTPEEQQELVDNCTWVWITVKGAHGLEISGYKATSKIEGFTDRFIFLPAGGYKDRESGYARSSSGLYWSNKLYSEREGAFRIEYAGILSLQGGKYLDYERVSTFADNRNRGLNVRAVHP